MRARGPAGRRHASVSGGDLILDDAPYDPIRGVVAQVGVDPVDAPTAGARRRFRRLVGLAAVLALGLLLLGAWVRLTGGAAGCGGGSGCEGGLALHRFLAVLLGLLAVAIAVAAWRWRERLAQPPWLATALAGVVLLQGLVGIRAPAPLSEPAIATAHFLGGLLSFVLLLWLWLRQRPRARYVDPEPAAALALPLRLAIVVLVAQIFLGGWTSANHAGLACPDLPACQGHWWPAMDFAGGFHFPRASGATHDAQALPLPALTAIHLSHRIGAVLALLVVGWAGVRSLRTPGEARLGAALLAALVLQWLLGLSSVWLGLPLPLALAHNGGAAVLLALLVVLHFRAVRAGRMV